jgi:DNA-binding NarL/FixJ family response regulator
MEVARGEQVQGLLTYPGGTPRPFAGWHQLVGSLEELRLRPPQAGAGDKNVLSLLTARERTVVARVAAGWSDAAIADQLELSIRTVASHIYNAVRKVGIPSGPLYNRRVLVAATYHVWTETD